MTRPRVRVRWVATVPPQVAPRRRAHAQPRYSGPPSYPSPPRWGFPHLAWRSPTAVPGTPSASAKPLSRLRTLTRNATSVLWLLCWLLGVAAAAELWRYVLLVQSRDSAINTTVMGASDALVFAAALLAFAFAVLALPATLWWLFAARWAAAEQNGHRPARPVWQVLLFLLIPVANLVLAGPVVAELEHAVLRGRREQRPKPSRLVLAWWAAWVVNGVLLALVIIWRFRDGVQAQADGVLLNVLTDLAALALTALTAILVRRLTILLAPIELPGRTRQRVLAVKDAPAPELRTSRPAGAAR